MASLQEVQQMAVLMIDLEDQVSGAEEVLSALKERLRVVKEETIPCTMQELGLEQIKLTTGESLSISQEVYCSIPATSKTAAFEWLTEHEFDGLIKSSIGIEFGRGEAEKATFIIELLREQGLAPSHSEGVHAQTLKAFVKEQLASGADFPLELFGARPTWTAKLKKAKIER